MDRRDTRGPASAAERRRGCSPAEGEGGRGGVRGRRGAAGRPVRCDVGGAKG
jgi:hypothetical protein